MFRNIAIFGEPATGKSTVARKLAAKIPNCKIIEASTDLIFPIAYHFKKLPTSSKILLSKLKKIAARKLDRITVEREEARKTFFSLSKQYSPSFIAEAIEDLYSKRYVDTLLIVTGVRGHENAKYFKKQGYLIVFLKTNKKDIIERLTREKSYSKIEALKELKEENRLYSTKRIEKEADLVFNTSTTGATKIAKKIMEILLKRPTQECKKCINTSQNPFIKFNKEGYCNVCQAYLENFDKKSLAKELEFFKSFIKSGKGKYDIMVGLSGGKDSSAVLYRVKEMGFTPLAFTFDIGYFHPYIYRRARNVAKMCQVDYEIIPVKKYITQEILEGFRRMAELYRRDKKEEFIKDYVTGRREYRGVIRPCWVCRKLIIHSRYFEALKHGVQVVAIGINEWTSLKQSTSQKKFVVSAIRKLKPFPEREAVYIVHLPFLIQAKLKDTRKVLKKVGWNYYHSIQSNAASCLLACAAEKPLYKNLGFHPDTTRLAREVTVGFLTKEEAKRVLKKVRECKYTVPQVLRRAKLIS